MIVSCGSTEIIPKGYANKENYTNANIGQFNNTLQFSIYKYEKRPNLKNNQFLKPISNNLEELENLLTRFEQEIENYDFKDKYDIRNKLVSHESSKLFKHAAANLTQYCLKNNLTLGFEDKIIFIADHIINALNEDKTLLTFISKNLSWGIFREALTSNIAEDDVNFKDVFYSMIDCAEYEIEEPEIMLFLITELVSSTCYSAILYEEPANIETIKPYLFTTIRSIIHQHETAPKAQAEMQ